MNHINGYEPITNFDSMLQDMNQINGILQNVTPVSLRMSHGQRTVLKNTEACIHDEPKTGS